MNYRGGGPAASSSGSQPPPSSSSFGDMPSIGLPPLSPKSLAKFGMGAYGDKVLGAGQAFAHNTYARVFSGSSAKYYFDVTEAYAWNKLKLILCPFVHRGSWARIPEQVSNGAAFKPPRNDINAPDLYIPLMAFWTYVLAASLVRVRRGDFAPDVVAFHFSWAATFWAGMSAIIWAALRSLSTAHVHVGAPIMDIAAYSGYAFVWASVGALMKASREGGAGSWATTLAAGWGALAGAVFVVKTTKRIIFSETRHHGVDGNRHNYLLLALAGLQFPFHFALANV